MDRRRATSSLLSKVKDLRKLGNVRMAVLKAKTNLEDTEAAAAALPLHDVSGIRLMKRKLKRARDTLENEEGLYELSKEFVRVAGMLSEGKAVTIDAPDDNKAASSTPSDEQESVGSNVLDPSPPSPNSVEDHSSSSSRTHRTAKRRRISNSHILNEIREVLKSSRSHNPDVAPAWLKGLAAEFMQNSNMKDRIESAMKLKEIGALSEDEFNRIITNCKSSLLG
mmetsp:Transcript_18247/g.29100  ORF Transcript_18247/g.29100 Transcript_18247/m.29100 type:complete len:224 (+) Transcript_18247:1-672(+)